MKCYQRSTNSKILTSAFSLSARLANLWKKEITWMWHCSSWTHVRGYWSPHFYRILTFLFSPWVWKLRLLVCESWAVFPTKERHHFCLFHSVSTSWWKDLLMALRFAHCGEVNQAKQSENIPLPQLLLNSFFAYQELISGNNWNNCRIIFGKRFMQGKIPNTWTFPTIILPYHE